MRGLLITPGVLLLAALLMAGCKPSTQTAPGETTPAQPSPPTTGPRSPTTEPGKPATELKAVKSFATATKVELFDIALSPDGATAVAGGEDYGVGPHLWDTAGRKVIVWEGADVAEYFRQSTMIPIYSLDGTRLWTVTGVSVGGSANGIIAVNTKTHKIEAAFPATASSDCLALSPDEKLLATGSAVYDLKSKKPQFEFGKDQKDQREIAFSHDGKTLVGRGKNAITIWTVETGMVSHTIPFKVASYLDENYHFLAVSPKANVFALSTGKEKDAVVEIRDLGTSEVKETFGRGLNLQPGRLSWSPDGKYLTVVEDLGYVKNEFRIAFWLLDATSGKPVASLGPTPNNVYAIAFSGDGSKLAIITKPRKDKLDDEIAELVLWDLTKLSK